MTILQALKLRGAEVQYVLCDGLYSDCDQFWAAVAPRPANACTICQAEVTRLVADMQMDFQWLGRYLTTEESREARRWARSLRADELMTATYGDWRVAEWVRGSVQSHFRSSALNVADRSVERGLRSYVYSGVIACFALDRLLMETTPDVLLVFNGRQSSTRVAFELARARNIRVVVHERGPRTQTLTLIENEPCQSLEPIRQYWRQWSDVPLAPDELEAVTRLMDEREHGRNTGWTPFTSDPQSANEVVSRLGLRADRSQWVLFTSSDDEVAGDENFRSPFASQRDWIERTIAHAGRNPQIDLVIRVHPNTGGRRSVGANLGQLEEMKCIGQNLPPNVRMIDPDDEISSYSLMDLCTLGLVWFSTVGLELACKGKNVVIAAGNSVSGTSFVHTVEAVASYDEMLESFLTLPPGAVSAEVKRLALRFAYGTFFRLPIHFPLVSMPTPNTGELAYDSLTALLPDRDPGVDRCARILLDDQAVCPPPTAEDWARSPDAEDTLLAGFGKPRVAVLAFAEELIADDALLPAWAQAFDGRNDITLLIQTLAGDTPRLIEAVTRAGLDGDEGPDLVAGEFDGDTMESVAAVFSRVPAGGALATAPRYGPASLIELAESI